MYKSDIVCREYRLAVNNTSSIITFTFSPTPARSNAYLIGPKQESITCWLVLQQWRHCLVAKLSLLVQHRDASQIRMLFSRRRSLFLPINIESDAWVQELLKAIELELQSFGRDVSRKDLRLFKVTLFFLSQTAN